MIEIRILFGVLFTALGGLCFYFRRKIESEKSAILAGVLSDGTYILGEINSFKLELGLSLDKADDVLHTKLAVLYTKVDTAESDLHAKLDTATAALLDKTEKALEVFHLHSATLAKDTADLKAHAKQYIDHIQATGASRIVPTRY